jgi:hypothetical protein
MPRRFARMVGWISAGVSLLVGLLGFAPFTPAILLVAVLFPLAALVVWFGAAVAGLVSAGLCVLALVISPLQMAQLVQWPWAMAWLVACLLAVMAGVMRSLASIYFPLCPSLFSQWRRESKSIDAVENDIVLHDAALRQSAHIKSLVRQRLADKHQTRRG